MVAIPFSVSSSPGVDAQESAGRIINGIVEKTEPGAPNPVIYYRAPGLNELVAINDFTHCRGFISINDTLLTVLNSRVFAIGESSGTFFATNLGAFAGSGRVTIARNNAATPNIVAVDLANGCKNLFTTSAPTDFADADLPASPLSVDQLHGYFLWVFANGQIWASGLNAVSVASNAFTTAQQRPGGLLRGVAHRAEFFAFGPNSCEVYRDAGASPFPLEYVTMIPRGIVGTFAVAGFEEGWTNELCWVGDDNTVQRLNGYSGTRISKHAVERAIESAADRSLIECTVAMSGGHAFLFVKSPGEWTWVHDLTTGEWQERNSYLANDFRASCSVRAFNRWIMGDYATGKIGEFTSSELTEFDNALIWELQSGTPATFPSRGIVARVDFDFTVAVATVAIPDPAVEISWSKDGGKSWNSPVIHRKLGVTGARHQRVTVQRVGVFGPQGIRFKLRISDAVHVGFKGGEMALLPLGA